MTTVSNTITATDLATEILSRKALIDLETKRLKELEAQFLAKVEVGDKIVVSNGTITVTTRTDKSIDTAALKQVVSRNVFAAVTVAKVSMDSWNAMNSLGRLNDDALALVVEKESAPFIRTTVNKA